MARKREARTEAPEVPRDDAEARRRALAGAIEGLKKKYGSDALQVDTEIVNRVDPAYRAETGLVPLDYVLCGGLVRGAGAVQLHAMENVGKSSIALIVTAFFQCTHRDAVHWTCSEVFNKRLAHLVGCRFGTASHPLPDDIPPITLTESVPDDERLIDISGDAIRSGAFGLEVVDSIAALRPRDEARMRTDRMVHAMRQPSMVNRLIAKVRDGLKSAPRTCVLFINQVRDTQERPLMPRPRGDMPHIDEPDTHYPAGRFLRHILLGAVRLTLEHHIVVERNDSPVIVGKRIRLQAEKLKLLGANGWEACVDFYTHDCPELGFRAGEVDHARGLHEVAEALGIVRAEGGGWYRYRRKKWHGAAAMQAALRADADLYSELHDACRAQWAAMATIPQDGEAPDPDSEEGADGSAEPE
jgi:RecA/RadA recombinase